MLKMQQAPRVLHKMSSSRHRAIFLPSVHLGYTHRAYTCRASTLHSYKVIPLPTLFPAKEKSLFLHHAESCYQPSTKWAVALIRKKRYRLHVLSSDYNDRLLNG